MKGKVAVLIPGHNEEKVIKATIDSCVTLIGNENVYVVDDGSTDKTSKIARKSTKNVLTLKNNVGKAEALNRAIEKFNLTEKYDYIMPVDSDTIVSENFFEKSLNIFDNDKKEKIACVVGKVVGRKTNWITTYRSYEYEINQTIHKAAQSLINGITVCPGPSTVYRSKVYKRLKYPQDTLTEDMDFTFYIHRRKLGKIVYEPSITVCTQDPKTIPSYIKQLKRWYTGFWQCITKHNVPFGGQPLDIEAAILATDGILNLFMVFMYFISIPILIHVDPRSLLVPPAIDLMFFMLRTIIFVSVRQKNYKLIFLLPHFYLLRFVSSIMFVYSFFKAIFGTKAITKNIWQTARYAIERRELWAN